MNTEQAIMNMKSYFDSVYTDVSLRGSGRGKFVLINKGLRGAEISVADNDTGWFVELWLGEEDLVDERVVELREDAIQRICGWLDGGEGEEPERCPEP